MFFTRVSVLEAKLEMNEAETERLKEEMLQKENEKVSDYLTCEIVRTHVYKDRL